MVRKVKWTNRALTELEKTVEYLTTNFSKKEIIKLEKAIYETLELIDQYPNVFPSSKKKDGIRKAVVLKYNNLISSFDNDVIIVLSFFSNRQNPSKQDL